MIVGYEEIQARLRCFDWSPSDDLFDSKVAVLRQAVHDSVQQIVEAFFRDEVPALALSGGVDSCVLARILEGLGVPKVRMLTLAVVADHPDMLHAGRMVKLLPDEWEWLPVVRAPEPGPRMDSYHYLYQAAAGFGIQRMIDGDCIDELLGGYYDHQANGESAFRSRLADLIPGHLEHMEEHSAAHGVTVHLPYAEAGVLAGARAFRFSELAGEGYRKRPMMAMARGLNVPEENIARRKLGLVSWQKK